MTHKGVKQRVSVDLITDLIYCTIVSLLTGQSANVLLPTALSYQDSVSFHSFFFLLLCLALNCALTCSPVISQPGNNKVCLSINPLDTCEAATRQAVSFWHRVSECGSGGCMYVCVNICMLQWQSCECYDKHAIPTVSAYHFSVKNSQLLYITVMSYSMW